MSDLREQQKLRDDIASVLELSRASWKIKKLEKLNTKREKELSDDFPRSKLFKTVTAHPYLTVGSLLSAWLITPARFGALAVAGASLLLRHRQTVLTFVEHIVASNVLDSVFTSFSDNEKSSTQQSQPSKTTTHTTAHTHQP